MGEGGREKSPWKHRGLDVGNVERLGGHALVTVGYISYLLRFCFEFYAWFF